MRRSEKHFILLFIGSLLLLFSCNNADLTQYKVISTEAIPLQSETILFSKDSSSYFYDLKITKDYLLFLDNSSDTIMQAYGKDSRMKLFSLKGLGDSTLFNPQFSKSDLQKTKNSAQIIDNGLYSKELVLKAGKVLISSSLLSQNMINSFDYNITSREIKKTSRITDATPYREKAFSCLRLIDDVQFEEGLRLLEEDLHKGPVRVTSEYVCIWGEAPTKHCSERLHEGSR